MLEKLSMITHEIKKLYVTNHATPLDPYRSDDDMEDASREDSARDEGRDLMLGHAEPSQCQVEKWEDWRPKFKKLFCIHQLDIHERQYEQHKENNVRFHRMERMEVEALR